MGIFDEVKKAATTVAGEVKEAGKAVGNEANKTGRTAQAQVKLRSLKGDQAEAEKELGQVAYELHEDGKLHSHELAAAVARVREAKAAVEAKEAEIAAIKAAADEAPVTAAESRSSAGVPVPPVAPSTHDDAEQTDGDPTTESHRMPGT